MISPDFRNRSYTAEILVVKSRLTRAWKSLCDIGSEVSTETKTLETGSEVTLRHNLVEVASSRQYHQTTRVVTRDGKKTTIPQKSGPRKEAGFLYDLIIGRCGSHVLAAVPFHRMAMDIFQERVDSAISGTGATYELVDPAKLVLQLGRSGSADLSVSKLGFAMRLCVTRCHLAYENQLTREKHIENVRLVGKDLGQSPVYGELIGPVLAPQDHDITVTPVVLGVSSHTDGVKRSTITTDRHGNFKVFVSSSPRQIWGVFDLIRALESFSGVTDTSTSVPIARSRSISEVDS